MRVLIFHGYLLHGTGSNVYNAELGRAFVRAGHELHLLCQDRSPLELPWVDAAGDWDGGALELTVRRDPPRATVYRPDLGGLLPVYVADRYDGVEARPYEELSEAEVAAYVERNVAAVAEVVARARPDVALANHLVMGPLILARALAGTGVPYAVKIHGSALEYTVKRHPRFLPAAREGLAGARGVLVGSRHTGESLWAALRGAGPGGQDPPRPARRRRHPLRPARAGRGRRRPGGRCASGSRRPRASPPASGRGRRGLVVRPLDRRGGRGARGRRPAARPDRRLRRQADRVEGRRAAARRLAARARAGARRAAARRRASAASAAALEGLAGALARGDLEAARALRGEDGRELPELAAFLDGLGPGAAAYRAAAAATAGRVHWAGRLEHAELADVLPAADAMAMPSTFPEAFGMVAAEAAACGALPVVAGHSGMAEVARALAAAAPAGGAAVADVRGRPARGRRSWPRAWRPGSRRPRTCAPPRARRSSASRASATPGTASRAP